MALWQGRSKRKPTGGRYRPFRKKRRREIGREQQYAFIGAQRLKLYRTKGANRKVRILSAADELDGGDLLPGFRLPVARLFQRDTGAETPHA